MKLLLTIVLTLAAIYAGVWVVASRGLDRGLQAGLTAAADQGWQIETSRLKTGGFPSRFDVTARDLSVTAPGGGFIWRAPWVETAALSYQPNKVIAVFPPQQTMQIGQQVLTLDSTGLRANVAVAANTALSFDTMTAEAQTLAVSWESRPLMQAGQSLFALRALAPQPLTYESYLSVTDIDPGVRLPGQPAELARLSADATVVLDRPLDRHAILPDRPLIKDLTLNTLDLTWGDLRVTGSGTLSVDKAGVPTGRIDITAQGWDVLIDLLAGVGAIAPQSVSAMRTVAGLMANGNALTLPLQFSDGAMALGPIPLGPAPRLRIP